MCPTPRVRVLPVRAVSREPGCRGLSRAIARGPQSLLRFRGRVLLAHKQERGGRLRARASDAIAGAIRARAHAPGSHTAKRQHREVHDLPRGLRGPGPPKETAHGALAQSLDRRDQCVRPRVPPAVLGRIREDAYQEPREGGLRVGAPAARPSASALVPPSGLLCAPSAMGAWRRWNGPICAARSAAARSARPTMAARR